MEIGAYSFGDTPLNPDGSPRPTAEAISNLHQAIVHADAQGLDYFGVGEHHTPSMPASSRGATIAAAAAAAGWRSPAAAPAPQRVPASWGCPSPTASSAVPHSGSPAGGPLPEVGRAGRPPPQQQTKISVAAMGLVAPTKEEAVERFYPGWYNLNLEMGQRRGWPEPDRRDYLAQADAPGAYYIGDPDEVAERIVHLHGYMGHMRHFLQMDLGGPPHEHLMESITLLATEAKPRVQRLLERSR